MNYESTIKKLRTRHSILECVFLHEHTVRSLSILLSKYKNPDFKDNERLIFIVDSSLPCSYTNTPPDMLIELQKIIAELTVPHFFIVVLSDIELIGQYLVKLQEMYYRQEVIPIPYILCSK